VAIFYGVIHEILKVMNDRLSVGGILCDLKKAFDCVNHGIIIDKLEFSRISGKFQTSIQNYHRGRKQNLLIGTLNSYESISSRWKNL
jgi:hypothetical protein